MSYTPATGQDTWPASEYPLVAGAKDEKAALDAFTSVNTLLDLRASQFPDDPFLCPIDLDKGICTEYTFAQTRKLVISVAAAFLPLLPVRTVSEEPRVVAVSGTSSGDFWVLDKAIQRLGHIPLFLSNTLTSAAALNLIRINEPSHILLGPATDQLQAKVQHLSPSLIALPWQTIEGHLDCLTWTPEQTEATSKMVTVNLPLEMLADQPCMICHTTGSTADPKSIICRNRNFLSTVVPELKDSKVLMTSLAHAYSFTNALTSQAAAKPIYIYPGAPFTIENIVKTIDIVSGKAEDFMSVPLFLKLLSAVPDGLNRLKVFKTVTTCGGRLPDQLVDQLRDARITVWHLLGSTEGGAILGSGEPRIDGFEWFDIPESKDKYFAMEPFEDSTYELIIKREYPSLYVLNREDGFATKDLFIPHPNSPRKWKYLKRKDDIIAHSIGLKTDPLFMEHFLIASPLISNAMVFGQGEPVAGALIIPTSSDVKESDVQALIDSLNDQIPSQSRLRPGLWKLLEPDDELYMSPKGTVIRPKTAEKWKTVIDGMYASVDPKVVQLQAEIKAQ